MIFLVIGIILLLVAAGLFFSQKGAQTDLREMQATDTSTVAQLQDTYAAIATELGSNRDYRDRVELKGTIRCNAPLQAELSQRDCVYYEVRVEREYEETETVTDSEGNSERKTKKKKDRIKDSKLSVPFFLEDETGRITIFPEKARIDTIESIKRYEEKAASERGSNGGNVQFGGIQINLGGVAAEPRDRVLGYHYQERLLPVDIPCYILGEVTNETGELAVRAPADGASFVISHKTEAQLVGEKSTSAKKTKTASIVCGALGLLGVAIGLISLLS